MELRHLRYFLAVAEQGSFNGAAEVLYVTQPALSRQIHDLEEELGTPLFQRLPKGVRLTDAGRAFREHAQTVFAELDLARTRLERMARGKTGVLRMGFNAITMNNPVVPAALRAHRAAHPDVDVRMNAMTSLEQLDGFRSGEMHVGFLNAEPDEHRELEFRELSTCTLDVALPRDHRLADQDPIQLGDLRNEDFIMPARSKVPWVHDRLIAACLARGFSPRVVQESVGIDTLLGMLDAGIGIGFIPSCMASRAGPGIVVKPVSDLQQRWPLYLVWRKGDTSPLTRAFNHAVLEAFASERDVAGAGLAQGESRHHSPVAQGTRIEV